MSASAAIIVPLRARSVSDAIQCVTRLKKLTGIPQISVIIADNSEAAVQKLLRSHCDESGIVLLENNWNLVKGGNKKMLNILAALQVTDAENVIVLDDDSELSQEVMILILDALREVGYVRTMVRFSKLTVANVIDLCGIFVVNVTTPDKQFWGMQAFHKRSVELLSNVDRNTVFDELTVFRHLMGHGVAHSYLKDVAITSHCRRTVRDFMEQRARYAYENLAYPLRTTIFCSLIPTFVLALAFQGLRAAWTMTAAISAAVVLVSICGWTSSRRAHRHHFFVNFAAPIWLLLQASFVWVAVAQILLGGKRFSGERLRRAA